MVERRMLRPLEIGSIFDEVYYLYRSNFLLFTSIAAVIYVPTMFLASLIWKEIGLSAGQYVILTLQPLVIAAGTYAISKRYLGEECSLGQAYSAIFRRTFRFIWTMLSVGFITFAASLALVFPGIIVYFWYVFVYQVFILEGLDSKEARARSKQLSEGHWWRIFVVYLIFGLLQGFATQLLSLPVFTVFTANNSNFVWAIAGLYMGILTAVVMVVQLIVSVLLYYDIRVRKEAFDIELLATELQARQSELQTSN